MNESHEYDKINYMCFFGTSFKIIKNTHTHTHIQSYDVYTHLGKMKTINSSVTIFLYRCRGSLRIVGTGSGHTDSRALQTAPGCSKRRFHIPGSHHGPNMAPSCLGLYTG